MWKLSTILSCKFLTTIKENPVGAQRAIRKMRPRIKLLIDCWKTTLLRWQNLTENYLNWDILPTWAKKVYLIKIFIELCWHGWNLNGILIEKIMHNSRHSFKRSKNLPRQVSSQIRQGNQIQHRNPNIKNLSGKLTCTYNVSLNHFMYNWKLLKTSLKGFS